MKYVKAPEQLSRLENLQNSTQPAQNPLKSAQEPNYWSWTGRKNTLVHYQASGSTESGQVRVMRVWASSEMGRTRSRLSGVVRQWADVQNERVEVRHKPRVRRNWAGGSGSRAGRGSGLMRPTGSRSEFRVCLLFFFTILSFFSHPIYENTP